MAVAESLKHNTTLQSLTIDCYHMGDEAGIAVAFTRKTKRFEGTFARLRGVAVTLACRYIEQRGSLARGTPRARVIVHEFPFTNEGRPVSFRHSRRFGIRGFHK